MDPVTSAATAPNWFGLVVPLLGMFAIFFVLFVYPQQRQAKKHKEMISALQRGDRIVTSSGVHGEVIRTDENEEFIKVEISKDVVIKLDKSSIARKIEVEVAKN
jgi:preprotein translocase subunit YajC